MTAGEPVASGQGTPEAACLEVVEPGLQATIQDGGRPGLGAIGVTAGGAADPASLAVANLLLGNEALAAAVELTLAGAVLRATRPVTVAVAGADAGARVVETGVPVVPGSTAMLTAGQRLAFEGGREPPPGRRRGCRTYLAVASGIDVPLVLGGRGTALGPGFGGFAGRALRPGDLVSAADPVAVRPAARWTFQTPTLDDDPLRILPGPHAGLLGPGALAALTDRRWTVAPASDRTGLRLDGDPLEGHRPADLASHGVVVGAIQVPPDGRPIVLLVDHQPTGGYPVVAVVIAADRASIGQLAPGDEVAFRLVGEAEAREAAAQRRTDLEAARAQLGEAAAWDALWHGAGG